jgi:glycosyltransferase involved in cell wall biosynthesis
VHPEPSTPESTGPLVSVILPAYNHEAFVEQAVRSIWSQTYRNVELIVIDDGSSDRTPEIIEGLAPLSPIPMQFLRKENEGVSRTLNRGLELARGEWITFVSSDDFHMPWRVEAQLAEANRLGPDYGCIHGDALLVDEHGQVSDRAYARTTMLPAEGDCFLDLATERRQVIGSTVFIRAECLRRLRGFDSTFVLEDYDLHLRLARITKFGFLDRPVTNLRCLPDSLGRRPRLWIDERLQILSKHREQLGAHYTDAVRSVSLRNVGVCLLHGSPSSAARCARTALAHAPGARTRLRVLRMVGVTALGLLFRRTVGRVLPQRVNIALKSALRAHIIH